MTTVAITQTDSNYKISVQPTSVKIGIGSISGYGPQGIPGATGPQGPAGPAGATTIDGITGLQAALDGKASVVHYHILDDITDFNGTVLAGGTF